LDEGNFPYCIATQINSFLLLCLFVCLFYFKENDDVPGGRRRGHRRNLTGIDQIEQSVGDLVSLFDQEEISKSENSRVNSEITESSFSSVFRMRHSTLEIKVQCGV